MSPRRITKSSPGPAPCAPVSVQYIDPDAPVRESASRGSHYFSGAWREKTVTASHACRGPGGTYLATSDRNGQGGRRFRVVRFGLNNNTGPVRHPEACAAGAWLGILPEAYPGGAAEYRTMGHAVTASRDLAACPAAWTPKARVTLATYLPDDAVVGGAAHLIDPLSEDPAKDETGTLRAAPARFALGFVGANYLTALEREAVLRLVASALDRAEFPADRTGYLGAPALPAAASEA